MLLDQDGYGIACFECGAPAEHQHHVIPRSRGGTKMVPLCVRCHALVHDVTGWRTDTLAILRRGQLTVLTVVEQTMRDRQHRQIFRAFREKPVGLMKPPALVKSRRVKDYRYEEWVPWLHRTSASQERLAAKVGVRSPPDYYPTVASDRLAPYDLYSGAAFLRVPPGVRSVAPELSSRTTDENQGGWGTF